MPTKTGSNEEPKRASSDLRPYRAGFWFGGFNGFTWMVGLGTPMVLLAERLGASTLQVGLASSFVFLLLPVQVISTATLEKLGYRKQMVSAWLVRALFLLIPLGLARLAPETPEAWMPNALVASVFFFSLLRAWGSAGHLPWFAAFLPDSLRGRFFATDQAVTSMVGVVTLLGSAALFMRLDDYVAFQVVYALAIFGSVMAVANLLRLPNVEAPPSTPISKLAAEARRLYTRPGIFRHYLWLSLLASVVTSSMGAFTVYYLKVEAGFDVSQILTFTAIQFAGVIVGTWSIRHLVDRIPLSRFFQIGVAVLGVLQLFWLLHVSGDSALNGLESIAFFIYGVGIGISNTAHYTYLPSLSRERERPVTLAVFTATHGLLCGIAPTLWGLALRKPGPGAGMHLDRFALYFALGIALSGLLTWLYARLPDHRLEGLDETD